MIYLDQTEGKAIRKLVVLNLGPRGAFVSFHLVQISSVMDAADVESCDKFPAIPAPNATAGGDAEELWTKASALFLNYSASKDQAMLEFIGTSTKGRKYKYKYVKGGGAGGGEEPEEGKWELQDVKEVRLDSPQGLNGAFYVYI